MKFKAIFQVSFLLLTFCLFFMVHSKAFAVTVSITQSPSTITQSPFTLTASISGATSGTNYLRIDIYRDGSTNYFGETYNGTDWYSGSDYHQYLSIPITNGQWTGTIQGSLGSPSTSEYDGTGTYKIRLRRYTGGGTTNATEADASSVVVQIITPTPTSAPTNTPTPVPTVVPSSTPKPTVTSQPTQKISPTVQEILAIATSSAGASDEGDILDDQSLSSTPEVKVAGAHTPLIPSLFIGIGGVILIGCGILFFYKYRLKKEDEDNANE